MSNPLPSSPTSEGREDVSIDEAKAILAARARVRASFECRIDGECCCVYCTRDAEGLAEHAADYELRWFRAATEVDTLRASLTEAQARATEAEAEIARLKADRDSWRRCADTRESERLELRCSFLDFVAYVRGESPSLLTDECVDAWRVIELESRLKSDGAQ